MFGSGWMWELSYFCADSWVDFIPPVGKLDKFVSKAVTMIKLRLARARSPKRGGFASAELEEVAL